MAIIGIDEVGRGAWAGPLVMAAVQFHSKAPSGINDSKQLKKAARERLAIEIAHSSNWAIVFYSSTEIDRIGLTKCLKKGALRLASTLNSSNCQIIIDGNYDFLSGTKYEESFRAVVRADTIYAEVMAASIIAKVSRDSYMTYIHRLNEFADYSFSSHVGYGTLKHRTALSVLGVTLIHRQSFKPVKLALESNDGNY